MLFLVLFSVDDAQLAADRNESLDGPVDVVKRMSSRDLHANSCFPFRYHRIAESNHVDPSTCVNNPRMDYFLLFLIIIIRVTY